MEIIAGIASVKIFGRKGPLPHIYRLDAMNLTINPFRSVPK
jgi:hypothetical protein